MLKTTKTTARTTTTTARTTTPTTITSTTTTLETEIVGEESVIQTEHEKKTEKRGGKKGGRGVIFAVGDSEANTRPRLLENILKLHK